MVSDLQSPTKIHHHPPTTLTKRTETIETTPRNPTRPFTPYISVKKSYLPANNVALHNLILYVCLGERTEATSHLLQEVQGAQAAQSHTV